MRQLVLEAAQLAILQLGGKGVISVVANIVPAKVQSIFDAFWAGDLEKARKIHLGLFPLVKSMFIETNPIPVKAAMNMMGMISNEVRLPMTPLSKPNKAVLKQVLKKYKLV